jgi:hypothetical protein
MHNSQKRNGSSFMVNSSARCAIKNATVMVIKIGTTVIRVRKPIATRNPQTNSAKITSINDSLEPRPM